MVQFGVCVDEKNKSRTKASEGNEEKLYERLLCFLILIGNAINLPGTRGGYKSSTSRVSPSRVQVSAFGFEAQARSERGLACVATIRAS
jgi:hypothetical protein